jgi:molybdate transport system substrate-binding protein
VLRHPVVPLFAAALGAAFCSLPLLAATPSPARAAEITLLGPASFRVLFPKLLPQFEKSSGDNVTAGYAPLGVITERVMKGEPVDVAIVSGEQNEALQKQGKLLAGSRMEIAQVGFTVFVKKGAAKPDLSSADALKRALLSAKSIAVGDPARGGGASLYTISLLKRLGIADEVKAKSRLEPSGTEIAEAVAKGETELGIGVASDLSLVAGIESVALPAEVQNYSLRTWRGSMRIANT